MAKLGVLRQIVSELRQAVPESNLKNNLAYNYIMKEYRKYRDIDDQLCKAKKEMEEMASTYLCYLRSLRLQKEIHSEFHGKGERTINETAKMVGFKLPHDPK